MTYKVTKTDNYEVRINNDGKRGSFEHLRYGEDSGGELLFDNGALYDYDGVYKLPTEVARELEVRGVNVDYLYGE